MENMLALELSIMFGPMSRSSTKSRGVTAREAGAVTADGGGKTFTQGCAPAEAAMRPAKVAPINVDFISLPTAYQTFFNAMLAKRPMTDVLVESKSIPG